jgi:hypothetical protein
MNVSCPLPAPCAYLCPTCGRAWATEQGYVVHWNDVHSADRAPEAVVLRRAPKRAPEKV